MESFVRKSCLYCITFPWMQRESESSRKILVCKKLIQFLYCKFGTILTLLISTIKDSFFKFDMKSLYSYFENSLSITSRTSRERCKMTQEVVASGKILISRNPIKSWKCLEKRLVWLWDLINLHLDLRVNWFSPSRSYGGLSVQQQHPSRGSRGSLCEGVRKGSSKPISCYTNWSYTFDF